MKKYFKSMSRQKWLMISILSFSFLVVAGSAIASMTFNTNTITSDGAINLNPTGQPVTVNGKTAIGDGLMESIYAEPFDAILTVRNTLTGTSGLIAGIESATIIDPATTPTGTFYGVDASVYIPDTNVTDFTSGEIYAVAAYVDFAGSGDVSIPLYGLQNTAYYGGTGVADQLYANWADVGNYGGGSAVYGVDYYASDLGPSNITNPYYSWFDSRGVGRCKEDHTFNSVGQSICVVYNPQFTKYTPGAANYERIVYGQWNSNVAEIGVEKGGTGTLRDLRLIGANVDLPNVKLNGKLLTSTTAPTISSGFGASPSVTANNGTATFRVNVGTGGAATTGVIGLPTATAGWNCFVTDITNPDSFVTRQTGSTTTTASFKNYSATTGSAIAWTASDILAISCTAF